MILHPDFLKSEESYVAAEAFWEREISLPPGWRTPWARTAFADGTRFRDGNPIYSAYHDEKKIGVVIIMEDPNEEPAAGCETWIEQYEADRWIVVALVLTEDNLKRAKDFIHEWIVTDGHPSDH